LRRWEEYLKVDGWSSDYESLDKVLRHYGRKVHSEKTRENVGLILKGLCVFVRKNPDELVKLSSGEASECVQGYVDSLAKKAYSVRYVNVCLAYLKTFFSVNGFRELEVERHYQPSRYRKRSEYVPSAAEIFNMGFASGSRRNKALILALYTSGLRNSTLRAVLYGDVKEELERGLEVVKLPVYAEMKKIDSGACKGNIPYYSFISKDATEAVRAYCKERKLAQGDIDDDEPLFSADSKNVKLEDRRRIPAMKRSLEDLVKRAARNSSVERWQDVYPHCLRKAFESALRNAGLDLKDQEFLIGHILPGTQDTYYDKTKVDDLRRKYAKVSFFPERGQYNENSRRRQILDTARLLGFADDKIKRIEEALARYEKVDEALDEIRKLQSNAYKPANEKIGQTNAHEAKNPGNVAKVVQGEQGLVNSLNQGWELVKELSNDKFLLKRSFD
jgi:site-specific recombinase XerD